MQKSLLMLALMLGMVACRDEINVPIYDGDEDTEIPVITVTSPIADNVYKNVTTIPVTFSVTDDYLLDYIECTISKEDGTQVMQFDFTSTDSIYNASETLTLPTTDSTVYKTFIFARDYVGNVETTSYNFTAK